MKIKRSLTQKELASIILQAKIRILLEGLDNMPSDGEVSDDEDVGNRYRDGHYLRDDYNSIYCINIGDVIDYPHSDDINGQIDEIAKRWDVDVDVDSII